MPKRPIYLDFHATTPVDPRVAEAMWPYFTEHFGNASSRTHDYGWHADRAVADARLEVVQLLGARSPDEIVFTSGATESNNLALTGVMRAAGHGHLITSAIEHSCVRETARTLTREGFTWTEVGVDADGLVSPADVEAAIRPDTRLISVMAVNNEVGTIQPVAEIATIAKRHGVTFHSDAAQAVGRIELDVRRAGIDLLSLSAHKIYGPKGVGALYVRRTGGPVVLRPHMSGGGQERGVRSGTLNVPGIVGLGVAARLVRELRAEETTRITRMRDRLLATLRAHIPWIEVNGSLEHRVGCNLNVSFGVGGDTFISALPNLAVSGGAACASGHAMGSHVLLAMGHSQARANQAIRMALGRTTTDDEVDAAAQQLVAAALRHPRITAAG